MDVTATRVVLSGEGTPSVAGQRGQGVVVSEAPISRLRLVVKSSGRRTESFYKSRV